jgi:hypothetical protein
MTGLRMTERGIETAEAETVVGEPPALQGTADAQARRQSGVATVQAVTRVEAGISTRYFC